MYFDQTKIIVLEEKIYRKIQKPTEIDLAKIERKRSNLPKIKLSLYNSHQLASKAIELKRLGDGRFCLNARAWFLKYNYPKEYKLFEKFNDFNRCSITLRHIRYLIKKTKESSALPKKLRQKLNSNIEKKREKGSLYF